MRSQRTGWLLLAPTLLILFIFGVMRLCRVGLADIAK